METRICTRAVWTLVLLAILWFAFRGGLTFLAVVLPVSLLLACIVGRRPQSLTDTKAEKQ